MNFESFKRYLMFHVWFVYCKISSIYQFLHTWWFPPKFLNIRCNYNIVFKYKFHLKGILQVFKLWCKFPKGLNSFKPSHFRSVLRLDVYWNHMVLFHIFLRKHTRIVYTFHTDNWVGRRNDQNISGMCKLHITKNCIV